MKITFIGTPRFGKYVFKSLIDKGVDLDFVVTKKRKPKGRGLKPKPSPVERAAQDAGIPVSYDLEKTVKKTDLAILAGYGKIIKDKTLKIPPHGFLNVHPSLLPKYRGPSPIQGAILSDDIFTGVSIMEMDSKMDHGPILLQEKTKIDYKNYLQLEKELAIKGGSLIAENYKDWVNKRLKAKPQNHSEATYTKLIKKSDGKINWNDSAEKIEKMTRAYHPWPGCYCFLDNRRIKIISGEVIKDKKDSKPGQIFETKDKKMAVSTGKRALLVKKLQIQGKKEVESDQFLIGNKEVIGSCLT